MAEIVGHRGASHDAPENTLPSVRLGFEQGADAVEVDVFATSDGRIVVIHDSDTKRVAGLKLDVAKSTLAQLRGLDVGSWKGEQWAGTGIPTLEEVLEAVPEGRRLLIEVKCGRSALPQLEEAIEGSGKRERVALISFSLPLIEQAKRMMRDVPAYWVYGFSMRERARWGNPTMHGLIRKAEKAGLDGLDLDGDGPISKAFVDKLRAKGMDLYVWTVNDPKRARKLLAMGVTGITTDRPGYLRRQLDL
jgi:glycerophosphoryl diester phosphodiesterase